MTTRTHASGVRGCMIKLVMAGSLIAVPVTVVSVPAYAAPGGTPNAPAGYAVLPASPPTHTPTPPPPPPPAPPANAWSDSYYCGGCDGGGGGGGGG